MKIPYLETPKNPIEAIDRFISEVSQVHEFDYGDCMRDWNHSLLILRQYLIQHHQSSWAKKRLNDMQMYIQFVPNWDVDSTKARILKDAAELREHLVLSENSGRAA